jgi:hypothetical protein
LEGNTVATHKSKKGRPKQNKKLRLFHSQTLVREKKQNEQASKNTYSD